MDRVGPVGQANRVLGDLSCRVMGRQEEGLPDDLMVTFETL